MMIAADPDDDTLARANERRGWPPRVENDGQVCDYIVIGPDDNPVEVLEGLFHLAQERGGKGRGTRHRREGA